jgi:hypothetical protein
MPILGITASSISASVAGGSYESIATTTVGGGGASDITFSSIPATYTHLQIRGLGRTTQNSTGADDLLINFNSDTSTNYSYHDLTGDGASGSASASAQSTIAFISLGSMLPRLQQSANSFGVAVIDILDYANTNKYKTTRALSGLDINAAGGFIALRSGNWRNTNAITTITLKPESSRIFAQYSQFALYGIKGA